MDTSTADPLVGQHLDGRYRIDARVARGGMATVYAGFDTRLDRVVAVKVMHATLADDPEFVERFRREAKAAARLSHSNVVAIYDQGEDAGHPFLVMEHVQGRTLRTLLREAGRLTSAEALQILEGMLAALAAAHTAGLVHRDIKPENVLLADSGTVKVADFGLARPLEATQHTIADGRLIGSPAYLAPEQVESGAADARTDLYSAGIVLFEMVTGHPPFTGEAALQVAYRHVTDDVPAPSTIVAGLPAVLDELVAAATRRDPQQRVQDAETMLSATRRARAGLPEPGTSPTSVLHLDDAPTLITPLPPKQPRTPPTPKEANAQRARRSRRKSLIIALVIGLILGVAGGVGWWFGSGRYLAAPQVLELDEAAARSVAEEQGLSVELLDPVFSEDVAKGLVVDQDPDPGDDVRRGGTLQIALSAGPDRVTVPPLIGKTEADAREALRAGRLESDAVVQVFNERAPAGTVVRITPPAGTTVRPGTKVRLEVSKGREPVTVPDLAGKTEKAARDALRAAGLLASVTYEFSESVAKGLVISQSVAKGTSTFRGENVGVTVSKGPELVTVPNVIGKNRRQAQDALRAAGLIGEFFGPAGEGRRVFEQSPEEGRRVRPGSTVICYVI